MVLTSLYCVVWSELCSEASSHEVFLLACAALANITFTDNMACDYLLQYSTARVLVDACQQKKAHSVFSKDQVSTQHGIRTAACHT